MGDQGGHEGPQTADSAQPAPAARPPSLVATDDDVVQAAAKGDARATDEPERAANAADCDIPHKKRKTRRGKSKRRFPYYKNGRKTGKMVKPEAPHNSNQFLLEDHGDMQFLQEPLSHNVGRTRDSSFSMDSDNEFYSSPDDEERYLIQDFFDQYESLQEERLQAMTKDELIQEHLMLEHKMEQLNKLLKNKQRLAELKPPSPAQQLPPPPPSASPPSSNSTQLQRDVERLTMENEALKRENAVLRSNSNSRRSCSSSNSSSSEDSETDSDDSCSSSTTSSDSVCSMPQHDDAPAPTAAGTIDYSQTNGHHATNGVETA